MTWGPVSRKSRKRFGPEPGKAIRETVNRLFWKVDLLTCLQAN